MSLNKKIYIILSFLGLVFCFHYFGGAQYLSLPWLQEHAAELKNLSDKNIPLGGCIYVLIYILSTVAALPGTFVLTMAGGYFFDIVPGIILANIGSTFGAIGAFLLSRHVIGYYVQQKYSHMLRTVNREFDAWGTYYLLMLRLVIIFPFFLVNLLLGLTRVGLWHFTWTTAVGTLPTAALYVIAGKELGSVKSYQDIFSVPIMAVFFLLTLLMLVPLGMRYKVSHK